MVAFPCSLAGLESRLFLPMSVTFYYSSIEKTDVRRIPLYILYLLFWFKVTNNSIPPYSRQLRARSISISATADDIFLVGAIDKIIKSIAERIR